MKRIVFCILLMLAAFAAYGQSTYTKVDSKTFQSTKTIGSSSSSYKATGFYYIAKDGKKYEIYLHTCKKGKNKGETFCYIRRVSKSGNPRWEKIDVKPEELK